MYKKSYSVLLFRKIHFCMFLFFKSQKRLVSVASPKKLLFLKLTTSGIELVHVPYFLFNNILSYIHNILEYISQKLEKFQPKMLNKTKNYQNLKKKNVFSNTSLFWVISVS